MSLSSQSGGSLFITTFNRTFLSWLTGIVIAEDVLGVLPKNTHDWNKFISPTEVQRILRQCECFRMDLLGITSDAVEPFQTIALRFWSTEALMTSSASSGDGSIHTASRMLSKQLKTSLAFQNFVGHGKCRIRLGGIEALLSFEMCIKDFGVLGETLSLEQIKLIV